MKDDNTNNEDSLENTKEFEIISELEGDVLRLLLVKILEALLELKRQLKEQNKVIQDSAIDNELECLKDIREKFKEFLEACKECKDAISGTNNGSATSEENKAALTKAENNFWIKISYLNDTVDYLIGKGKQFDKYIVTQTVKESYKIRFRQKK